MYNFVPKRIANKAEIKAKTRAIKTCVSVTIIQLIFDYKKVYIDM